MELDEDAVICDFAETYRIYDIYQYPCDYIATLAAGLRENSRIKIRQKGLRISPELFAISTVADNMRLLMWSRTKDGRRRVNVPESLVEFFSTEVKPRPKPRGFHSGEDFLRAWNTLMKGEEEHA